ncbi:hypothetical protein Tco_0047308 [Tanacetum coccineum]
MKRVTTFTPMESDDTVPKVVAGSSKIDVEQELNQESSKRQKIGEGSEPAEDSKDELSQEQLQQLMIIVPEEGMNSNQIFEDMLKNFDRYDLVKLWSLVHERFNLTEPTEDKERETLGRVEEAHDIFMLVEKDYPLTRALMTLMLSNKLQVDEYSVMAVFTVSLLRFVYFVLPNLKTNTAFCLGETLPNSFLDCVLSQDLAVFYPRVFIAFCLQQNCVLSKALHCDLLPAFCLLLKTFIAFW